LIDLLDLDHQCGEAKTIDKIQETCEIFPSQDGATSEVNFHGYQLPTVPAMVPCEEAPLRSERREQAPVSADAHPGRHLEAHVEKEKCFRVHMPEPYSGLWCRRSKQLDDRHRHYAEHGAMVSGHVEDGGKWLRIDSTIFLPMHMGNLQILEPVPETTMVFSIEEGWLTRASRALAQFIDWGGNTSHDTEALKVTETFFPMWCGCKTYSDSGATTLSELDLFGKSSG